MLDNIKGILVVDDEEPARFEIISIFKDWGYAGSFFEGSSSREAWKVFESHKDLIDLIFLDINMPGETGLEFAERLLKLKHSGIIDALPPIVFITAYDQYAVEAFELEALDYVLKPLRTERLSSTIRRISEREKALNSESSIQKVLSSLRLKSAGTIVGRAADSDERIILKYSEILYFRADGDKVSARARNALWLVQNRLKDLEQSLDSRFFRTHKAFIVNRDLIDRINPGFAGAWTISFKNDKTKVPVSRRHAAEFRKTIGF